MSFSGVNPTSVTVNTAIKSNRGVILAEMDDSQFPNLILEKRLLKALG
jgi:hypothetical protein